MGRNSLDATKACLSRAVRAAVAARLAVAPRLTGLRLLIPDFFLVAFLLFVFPFPDFDLALRAERWPEFLTESSCVCAATGSTTIRNESTPATERAAMPEQQF
jgi:hypothetical protein